MNQMTYFQYSLRGILRPKPGFTRKSTPEPLGMLSAFKGIISLKI